jgi:lysine 2,3-aminomutase
MSQEAYASVLSDTARREEICSVVNDSYDPAKWADWRWQMRHRVTRLDQFERLLRLTDAERRGLMLASEKFSVAVTPQFATLIDPEDPGCPIRKQVVPVEGELVVSAGDMTDPLSEDDSSVVEGLVHRYPDRVLFLVLDTCAAYCRYCTRSRLVSQGELEPLGRRVDAALAYLEQHTEVRDVLLSGGDPLLLATRKLAAIVARLRAIPHVETIRIGTRLPVVCPMRVDAELVAALRAHHPVFVNTHFNHVKELTPEARAACERLVDAGIPVGNQTVLLRGVNSSVRSLRALMRGLLRARVRPYYLFQGDTVIGTDHLRTPVETAIELHRALRGWINGMAVPHLVLDAPGGGGKVPLGASYLESLDDDRAIVRTYRGALIEYPQPRARDCAVPYDDVWFAGEPDDDDREGCAE